MTRRTSRAILINSKNEILLLRINGTPLGEKTHQSHFWVTVGGEIEKGESEEAALKRELREEVGIIKASDFKLIAFGEHTLPWKGSLTRFIEKFFIVYADEINYDRRNLTDEEVMMIQEYRWWSIDELLNTKEVIFPSCLPKLMLDYVNHTEKWVAKKILLD